MSFERDDKIQAIAEAYALDAVDFAREHFRVALDWSDGSVRDIEAILDRFHKELSQAQPSQEQIVQFGKMFGSYVGEVFRRNHGGSWGLVTLEANTFPGMRADRTGATFWPWGRVQNRLANGAEDNVWHYFQVLAAKDGHGPELQELDLTDPKPSWWRKVFGRLT